ncbi:MAG: B12-binding domain-containing radical SAM protein [Magnetococcales bacterium]|nr:B12-binding domain-containing radical SAM protein [Magnetococcales bacterium]
MALVTLVNPNLMVQSRDRFTTGVVYMPIGLAYVASALREAGLEPQVIDAFAAAPRQARLEQGFLVLGLRPEEVIGELGVESRVLCIYANQVINHLSVVALIRACKRARPELAVVILENTQAVTAYSLQRVASDLFAEGADYLLSGEAERRVPLLVRGLVRGDSPASLCASLEGVCHRDHPTPVRPPAPIGALDTLPFPAWDLFPLENYWGLGFAHGPLSGKRYLPLLTSRGCPFACGFCVIPATNDRRWRGRSGENVVAEMAAMQARFGVDEFHIEDVNPTVSAARTRELCRAILDRRLRVTWKLVSGTKVETIRDEETVALMAEAGCRYISISPESGSEAVLEAMGKSFKREHAERIVKAMRDCGIRSQACFVLGYPGEGEADRDATRALLRRLTFLGVDEVALFIITPVPGAAIFDHFRGYASLSDLNFTPSWRQDYATLVRFRLKLYALFLWWKWLRYPGRVLWQGLNFLRRRFETKMEMIPYRAWVYARLERQARNGVTKGG